MAYAERRERQKGVRYRCIYKAADGRYRSAGTFSTEERALEVAKEAERRAAEVVRGAAGGLDPGIRATRTIKEYAPLFLRHHRVEGNTKERYADTLRLHVIPFLGGCRLAETDRTVARNHVTVLLEEGRSANTIRQAKVVLCAMFGMAVADGYVDYNPFHDVKIPKVPGQRAIKVATPEQYLTVRACLPNKPAQVFSTLLVSSGIRFCEAVGLQPDDFDFEAGILEVARSVVKVSRQHHPQGKTFLVRDYTKNGQTRRLRLDQAVVELVRGHVAEHGIGEREVMFPADLVVPPRRTTAADGGATAGAGRIPQRRGYKMRRACRNPLEYLNRRHSRLTCRHLTRLLISELVQFCVSCWNGNSSMSRSRISL